MGRYLGQTWHKLTGSPPKKFDLVPEGRVEMEKGHTSSIFDNGDRDNVENRQEP